MGTPALRVGPTGVARALGLIVGVLPLLTYGLGLLVGIIPTAPATLAVLPVLSALAWGSYRHFAAPIILVHNQLRRWAWFRYRAVPRDDLRESVQVGRFWAPRLGDGQVLEVVRRDGQPIKLWATADDGLPAVQKRLPDIESWLSLAK